MRLRNKVAMITGAGGVMGQAISQRFSEEGADLVLTDISERRLSETVELLKKENNRIVAIRSDVLNFDEVKNIAEEGIAQLGKIDILVNTVGGIRSQPMNQSLLEIDGDRWGKTMDLNLKGTLNCIQNVAPNMLENEYGKIINISSINFAGESGFSDYGVAKAGVASLTKTAAMELGPNINVNCIAPGLIETSVLRRMNNEEIEDYKKRTMLGRNGKPIDIANTALFLASDESRHITAQIISVAGGITPHL